MQLSTRETVSLLAGATVGAGIGVFVAQKRLLGDPSDDLRAFYALLGAVIAGALVVLVLVYRKAYSNETALDLASFNGIGTKLYGRRDTWPDGSFLTTHWVIFLFFPVIPVCSLRVIETSKVGFRVTFKVLARSRPHVVQVVSVYFFALCAATALWYFFVLLFGPWPWAALILLIIGSLVFLGLPTLLRRLSQRRRSRHLHRDAE